jgi:hypothetical protein
MDPDIRDILHIMTYLMVNINNASDPYSPYMKSLPSSLHGIPALIEGDALDMLKLSPLHELSIKEKDELKIAYRVVCDIIPEFN